jgi:large subunit ribosomal protein L6
MSRIGKRIFKLSKGVEVKQDDDIIKVKGPKGEITIKVVDGFKINLDGDNVSIQITQEDPRGKLNALHGLYGALLRNALIGVTEGYTKKLFLVGVGYKAQLQGKKLTMALGYSHPIEVAIPAELTVACPDQTTIEISGIRKDLIGQFAAEVISNRPPEPYKGKGILYENQKIRRKVGKAGGKK